MSKNNPWNFNYSLTELENRHSGLKKDVNKTRLWDAYRWFEWEYHNINNVKIAYGNEEVAKRNRHYEAIIREKDQEIEFLKTDGRAKDTKVVKAQGSSFLVTGVVGIAGIIVGALIGMFAV